MKGDIQMTNNYIKRYSTSLITREMQNKTTMGYNFAPNRMAEIKKTDNTKYWWRCGAAGTLTHCKWKCKMAQSLWKTVRHFLLQLSTCIPSDSSFALLGICQEAWMTYVDQKTETRMFTEDWFIIAPLEHHHMPVSRWLGKQTECSHTVKCCSAVKEKTSTDMHMVKHKWISKTLCAI